MIYRCSLCEKKLKNDEDYGPECRKKLDRMQRSIGYQLGLTYPNLDNQKITEKIEELKLFNPLQAEQVVRHAHQAQKTIKLGVDVITKKLRDLARHADTFLNPSIFNNALLLDNKLKHCKKVDELSDYINKLNIDRIEHRREMADLSILKIADAFNLVARGRYAFKLEFFFKDQAVKRVYNNLRNNPKFLKNVDGLVITKGDKIVNKI